MNKNISLHWKFFSLVFIWSWGLFLIPIALNLSMENTSVKILFAIGGIAPTSSGIIMAYLKRDKEYWQDFWHRILNFKQISGIWYLIIFTIIPATSVLAIFFNYLLTHTTPKLDTLNNFLSNPIQLVSFAVFMLIFGPIPEEIGWRGFALDHLEKHYNWFVSSIILGFFWSLWHLPMFFIEGTYQYNLINESFLLFVDFNMAIFAQSIIMDWVYNNNSRSILSGLLVHFCTNFFGEILDLPSNIMYLRTIVQVTIAIMILIFWKAKPFRTVNNMKN